MNIWLKKWWINNGIRVWESIVQRLGCKTKTIDLETDGEIILKKFFLIKPLNFDV
jgi:hypothetical protein